MCHYRPEHYLISAAVNAEVQLKYLDPESGTLIFRSELEYCGDHCGDHCGGNFRVGGQLPLQYLLLYMIYLPTAHIDIEIDSETRQFATQFGLVAT